MSSISRTEGSSPSSRGDILKVSILGSESIHIGFHLIPYIVKTILTSTPSSNYVFVSDTTIGSLHLPNLLAQFNAQLDESYPVEASAGGKQRPKVFRYLVPPGESAKSRRQKEEIEDYMLVKGCTRDTVLIALGGGVVGDLAGFVAATYMRGIKYVQIPTTLLAMVDSSVGGKTAVDTPHGKNFIGAFWQPTFVFCDLAFLETLSPREFSNGMAEVVKTAAIWKEDDFAILESHANEITEAIQTPSDPQQSKLSEGQQLLLRVVTGSIYVKAHIVTLDERETGLRNLVNFGHTIGHAIEAILTPKMLHGECVAIGMILEAEVARQLGTLSQVAVGRIARALKAYNLPISLSDPRILKLPQAKNLGVNRLMEIMAVDKKNSGKTKKVVLLSRIGKTYEEKASAVEDAIIYRALCEAVRVRRNMPRKEIVMSTPGSKSISNRALVLAALGKGVCRMRNLLHSDDTAVMMAALVDLNGASFAWEDGGDTLVVTGGEGKLTPPTNEKQIYLGNAGTAARFLTAVCTLVQKAPHSSHTTITGNARMKQRPIGPLVDALRENGADVEYKESDGCLPLKIAAGGLNGGHVKLAASVSSQYVSAVLLCAPYAHTEITLELTGGQVISQPYIDMTIAMMAEFGVNVQRNKDEQGNLLDVYTIPKRSYVNPAVYNVESDASSATYPLAIAAITGTTCTIDNIGSSSLQGDAGFAKNILEPMGCKVVQTATKTTVTGPPVGQLRALGLVDMETMTDAFLTASVLAAVAAQPAKQPVEGLSPTATKIYGIANQRVKECNRIKAMRDQLAKFGVETDEFDDGIIITGREVESLKSGARVHCYDDHRVGMAFSVLSVVVTETVIDEKRCVEKTWPNWWDDLERVIGIPIEGVDLEGADRPAAKSTYKSISSASTGSTIFLIGMRGAGKTTVGNIAAETLGRPFLDADDYFVTREGVQISQYVAEHGWAAFRERERVHLEDLIEHNSHGYVISLGGGVVETPACRELLTSFPGPVVHVARDVEEIRRYLGEIGDTQSFRPIYNESAADVFRRRSPWFSECSSYEYINYTAGGAADQKDARREVSRFFRMIAGVFTEWPDVSVDHPTRFVVLTLPDVTPILPLMDQVQVGADAIEFRVDLLSPSGSAPREPAIPPPAYVAQQLAALRAHSDLPIVYSVRTFTQGGFFPDGQVQAYAEMVKVGFRSACEFVDVEIDNPDDVLEDLVGNKGFSRVVASWHDWSGEVKWNSEEVLEKFQRADQYGDIVKLIATPKEEYDNTLLSTFVREARRQTRKPVMAINMGAIGQITRVLNPILSPVTHPALPVASAPGQMSVAQIHQTLHLIGKLPAKKFYLFGTPISQSLSPIIHNTGFQLLGLPHSYELHETPNVHSSIPALLERSDFGGASVTIPHKLAIMPLLDEISADAKAIGAVNTITVKKNAEGRRILYGDNSDWKAIRLCAERTLIGVARGGFAVLVIGAGGTSRAAIYAAHHIGAEEILLYNRTKENAIKVAESFPSSYKIRCIDDLTANTVNEKANVRVVISTVPGQSCTLDASAEGIHLPDSLLSAPTGGVVIDLAYRPYQTPLTELAKRVGDKWSSIPGVEILCEQAFVQFEGWTGRRAPASLMRRAALEKYMSA